MNKIQQTIWVNATKIECVDNKLIVIEGDFYFQGKKYTIAEKEIKGS